MAWFSITSHLQAGLWRFKTINRDLVSFHSEFVGWDKFQDIILGYDFYPGNQKYVGNGCYQSVVTFITAIVFAILLNEIKSKGGKKVVQTISYLPHFLSWIIVTGILHDMLSGGGIVNELLLNFHIISQPINFFAHPGYFWPIVAFANVWKETGWNAIIYLAAITSIDPSLYEAAAIDGAGRWQKSSMLHFRVLNQPLSFFF